MDEHDDIRSLLTQAASDVPAVAPDAPRVVRRARRRATGTMTAGALAIVALLLVGTPAIRDLLSVERPSVLPAITGLDDGAYIVDLSTGRSTRLEGLPPDAVEFAAAPGGEQIAFVSARDGSPQVFVMNIDGTELRRVTEDPFGATAPAWSPDGTRIAYSGFGDALSRNIFVLELTTGAERKVTSIRDEAERPAWSRDGQRILYIVKSGPKLPSPIGDSVSVVREVDLGSGRDRRVFGGTSSSVVDVDVASDGRLFVASISGPTTRAEPWNPAASTLYDISVADDGRDGTGTLVYAGRFDDFDPEASPDASKVAFTSFIDGGDTPAVRTIDLQGRPLIGPIHWAHAATWLSDELLLVDVGCREHASSSCPA